jgi:hypothetical protein
LCTCHSNANATSRVSGIVRSSIARRSRTNESAATIVAIPIAEGIATWRAGLYHPGTFSSRIPRRRRS